MAAPQIEEAVVEDPMDKALNQLYYNAEDPGSYGGVVNLFHSAKKAGVQSVIRARVKQFLADQQSYSLEKPAGRHFKRNPIYIKGRSMLSGRLTWRTCRR